MASLTRLNKLIADSGICSRREADRLIESEQVMVNGKIIQELGTKIDPSRDQILVNGNPLPEVRKYYLLFHKPTGYITSRSDERGRTTIYDLLPPKFHAADPAGRLDKESSGALLLSNDGDFLYKVTHPKFHLPKVYRVTVKKPFSQNDAKKLLEGIMLAPEGKLAKVEQLECEDPFTLKMTLITGYNRQIRRTLETLGYEIEALKRVSIGPIRLGDLKPGKARLLKEKEYRQLLKEPFNRSLRRNRD
jgi:23S rRNA pseudouridine2605 synthase